jgi:NAD(P)-dependent dehydrogenase (short-subunit alcohol dehydrogenase family)
MVTVSGANRQVSGDRDQRVAIVTGGGTGIGRATSLLLAQSVATAVVVTYSQSSDAAEEVVSLLKEMGCDAISYKADVTSEDAIAAMIAECLKRWGQIDILINNAGTTEFIPFDDLDAAASAWDRIHEVNVQGTFRCTRLAAEHLRKSRGVIVNVGSIAGIRASGSSLPYSVSKAAVHHLTRGLAVALAPQVRVNAIAPGTVDTRWYRGVAGDDEADRDAAAVTAKTPLHGIATPEQCAQAIVGLINSEWVTGEIVVVDGGRSLQY